MVLGGLNAPPAPFVPEEVHFRPGYVMVVTGFGSPDGHAEVLERVRSELPPLFEFVTPMPYVALQQLLDESQRWGQHVYEKSSFLDDLTDEVIEVITEHVPAKTSPTSAKLYYRLDQAFSDLDDDATAFGGGRTPRYACLVVGVCQDAESLPAEQAWVRSFWQDLTPHAISTGGYVNALGDVDQDRVRASYGRKYQRLAQVKAEYDPGDVFHLNANIKPA